MLNLNVMSKHVKKKTPERKRYRTQKRTRRDPPKAKINRHNIFQHIISTPDNELYYRLNELIFKINDNELKFMDMEGFRKNHKLIHPQHNKTVKSFEEKVTLNKPIDDLEYYPRNKDVIKSYANQESYKLRLLRMLNILKTNIPWILIKPFFIAFEKNNTEPDIVEFFDTFLNHPDIKQQIYIMNQLIQSRIPTPLPKPKISFPILQNLITKQLDITLHEIDETQRANTKLIKYKYTINCVSEYRRAPWMHKFTNIPIKGFVSNKAENIIDVVITINGKKTDWYKVTSRWYREACEKGRNFSPNTIGYLLVDNSIIIETQEMYNASLTSWNLIKDIKFVEPTTKSFDTAFSMLQNNFILNQLPDKYINGICSSLNSETNYTMAQDLSKILVYLIKLLTTKQVHHFRVKHQQYDPNILIKLNEYNTLPEIFKDPMLSQNDFNEINAKILQQRKIIEYQFYNRLNTTPGQRIHTSPKIGIFKLIKTHNYCPNNIGDDVFLYTDHVSTLDTRSGSESGVSNRETLKQTQKLVCVDRTKINKSGFIKIENRSDPDDPDDDRAHQIIKTKQIPSQYFSELKLIKNPTLPNSDISNTDTSANAVIPIEHSEDVRVDRNDIHEHISDHINLPELAPGLFNKLSVEIALLTPIYCSKCNTEIFIPKFRSIKNGQKVQFCDIDCFDSYSF